MATAEQVLDIERRWLDAGTAELPGQPRNRVPGITDQPGFVPAAWCDAFQWTCLREAGVDAGPQSMWVSFTIDYFRRQGRTFTDPHKALPGDLVAFEWGTTGGPRDYDHIGMVEKVRLDGLVTIEGNVGDRVQRLFRAWNSGMAEFARPVYDPATTPSTPQAPAPGVPAPAPQEDDMEFAIARHEVTNGIYGLVGNPGKGWAFPQLLPTPEAEAAWRATHPGCTELGNAGLTIDVALGLYVPWTQGSGPVDVQGLAASIVAALGPDLAKQLLDGMSARLQS